MSLAKQFLYRYSLAHSVPIFARSFAATYNRSPSTIRNFSNSSLNMVCERPTGDWAGRLENADDVYLFWFGNPSKMADDPEYVQDRNKKWWSGSDEAFNAAQIGAKDLIRAAAAGSLDWTGPWGMLSKILLLDQFSRCAFRGTLEAFAGDPMALQLIREVIDKGYDKDYYSKDERLFARMPLMHSESLADQELLLSVIDEGNRSFAESHHAVIARFGRFPHRNEEFGRESTPEEVEWLAGDLPAWAKSQKKK